MRFCCLYALKWKCLKGASTLNLLDFAMNVLCSLQVILVFVYSTVINSKMEELGNEEKFADIDTPLLLFDLLNSFEALLYLLMAIS